MVIKLTLEDLTIWASMFTIYKPLVGKSVDGCKFLYKLKSIQGRIISKHKAILKNVES